MDNKDEGVFNPAFFTEEFSVPLEAAPCSESSVLPFPVSVCVHDALALSGAVGDLFRYCSRRVGASKEAFPTGLAKEGCFAPRKGFAVAFSRTEGECRSLIGRDGSLESHPAFLADFRDRAFLLELLSTAPRTALLFDSSSAVFQREGSATIGTLDCGFTTGIALFTARHGLKCNTSRGTLCH